MIITRDNYESYFIDFIDGNLSEQEQELLCLFLDENPDLKRELNGINDVVLEQPHAQYHFKQNLKRADFNKLGIENELDYLCIAELENDISYKERDELHKLTADSKKNRIVRRLYSTIRLKPNLNLVYPNKSALKRTRIFSLPRKTLIIMTSAAAGVLILVSVFTLLNLLVSTETEQIVSYNDKVSVKDNEVINDKQKKGSETVANRIEPIVKPKLEVNSTDVPNIDVTPKESVNQSIETKHLTNYQSVNIIKPSKLAIKDIASLAPQLPDGTSKIRNIQKQNEVEPLLAISRGGSRQLSFIDIAERGVNRLAKITGTNMNLNSDKDTDGRVRKVSFESTLFAVSVPVNSKRD
ncbi:MAG: hypothetical protein ACLFNU_01520 [Bacteroidales bacterium]